MTSDPKPVEGEGRPAPEPVEAGRCTAAIHVMTPPSYVHCQCGMTRSEVVQTVSATYISRPAPEPVEAEERCAVCGRSVVRHDDTLPLIGFGRHPSAPPAPPPTEETARACRECGGQGFLDGYCDTCGRGPEGELRPAPILARVSDDGVLELAEAEETSGLDEARIERNRLWAVYNDIQFSIHATDSVCEVARQQIEDFVRAPLQAQLDEVESRLERAEAALAEAAAKQRWNLRSFEAQLARAAVAEARAEAAEARERQMAEALMWLAEYLHDSKHILGPSFVECESEYCSRARALADSAAAQEGKGE